jgi:hypothetical protein
MNAKLINDAALGPWISAAFREMQPDAKQELAKCLFGNGEVRCVFYARAKAYSIKAVDYSDKTVTEVWREELVPSDAGFALPVEGGHA